MKNVVCDSIRKSHGFGTRATPVSGTRLWPRVRSVRDSY